MPERYHALDSLRGFAMLLGVVLHAGISFMTLPPEFWSVRDNDPSPLTDLFMFAVHDFRMQVFFVLAGFFSHLLFQRYGTRGMAWHRVKRVAIPFVLGIIFIVPTIMAAFMYVELENARAAGVPENATEIRKIAAGLIAANPRASNAEIILDRFTNGPAMASLPLAHLWFLYYLIIFYAVVVLLSLLRKPVVQSRLSVWIDHGFRGLVQSRGRVVVPALMTLPVLLCMRSPVVDTPLSWIPETRIIGYYFLFFAFGWMLHRCPDLVASLGRGWRLNLILGNLVVLPAMLGLTFAGIEASSEGGVVAAVSRTGAFAFQALYTWMMIVGLWGAFLHYFSHTSPWTRYLADASYWCYLASITPIVVLQFVVKDWPLPGLLKWLLVTTATMVLLLASYEWFVRYTVIGAILNGRKYRRKRSVVLSEERLTENVPAGPLSRDGG